MAPPGRGGAINSTLREGLWRYTLSVITVAPFQRTDIHIHDHVQRLKRIEAELSALLAHHPHRAVSRLYDDVLAKLHRAEVAEQGVQRCD